MVKQRPGAEQLAEAIAQPHFGRTRGSWPRPIPIQPAAMVVAVDEIDVYDHNPPAGQRTALKIRRRSGPRAWADPDHHPPAGCAAP